MADVALKGVCKVYDGDVRAVTGLDVTVRDGEFVVLVGPSGCGKTTTLRMIAGLEEITSGDLSIAGKRMNDVAPRDRDIAMVFQSYALYPHMTVYENMAFGLRIRRLDDASIAARVGDAARLLELEDLLGRRPRALSGGQRQRVAMGRAIVREPGVFLFDEPLSNLDAKLRGQMRLELAALHRRLEATMIYVTHDQVEAMTLADRIVILDGGELQQVGTPMEVYHEPANRFVAGFIGSPAMNFVSGVVRGEEDGLGFHGGGLKVPFTAAQSRRLFGLGVGASVSLGIRPHHLCLSDAGVEATVEHADQMGAECYLHIRLGSHEGTLVVRAPGDRAWPAGTGVQVGVDSECVHLFDSTGRNLFRDCARRRGSAGGAA